MPVRVFVLAHCEHLQASAVTSFFSLLTPTVLTIVHLPALDEAEFRCTERAVSFPTKMVPISSAFLIPFY